MRYGMVIDLNRCVGCDTCAMACKQHNGTPKGVYWSKVLRREKGKYPNSHMHYQPMLCMQCKEAECERVCPTGASYKREDGIVAIDPDKCIGCEFCVMACPYGARTKLIVIQPYYPEKGVTPYERAICGQHQTGVVGKCDFCASRLEEDKKPACVQACVAIARHFGDLDDPESEVSKLVETGKAKPLLPDVGTDPSVFYIEYHRR